MKALHDFMSSASTLREVHVTTRTLAHFIARRVLDLWVVLGLFFGSWFENPIVSISKPISLFRSMFQNS